MSEVVGMCEKTGTPIRGIAHVRQSLSRIILTLIGTRVQRREFGTQLLALISAPGNEATRLRAIAIIAKAILNWEPRVKLSHILFNVDFNGRAYVELHCSYKGQGLNHQVPLYEAAA